MSNKSNVTRTASREYWTTETEGIFHAEFRPLNPKTGAPWQASRGIVHGWNVFRLSNCKTGETTGIRDGKFPKDWMKFEGREWLSGRSGFKTEADALAAIDREKQKSGK